MLASLRGMVRMWPLGLIVVAAIFVTGTISAFGGKAGAEPKHRPAYRGAAQEVWYPANPVAVLSGTGSFGDVTFIPGGHVDTSSP